MQGAYSEYDDNPSMSIGCMIVVSSDILKEISSLNEQAGPTVAADQTMRDSLTKSDNQSFPVSNSTYPTITSQPAILSNITTSLAPNYSQIEPTTENNWGLNNLSLSGILNANPAVLPAANYDGGLYVNSNDAASQGWPLPSARGDEFDMIMSDGFMDNVSLMYPNGVVNAEMLSLWSEASAAFR